MDRRRPAGAEDEPVCSRAAARDHTGFISAPPGLVGGWPRVTREGRRVKRRYSDKLQVSQHRRNHNETANARRS